MNIPLGEQLKQIIRWVCIIWFCFFSFCSSFLDCRITVYSNYSLNWTVVSRHSTRASPHCYSHPVMDSFITVSLALPNHCRWNQLCTLPDKKRRVKVEPEGMPWSESCWVSQLHSDLTGGSPTQPTGLFHYWRLTLIPINSLTNNTMLTLWNG